MDFDTKLQLKLSELLEKNLLQIPEILEATKKDGITNELALIHTAVSSSLTITTNLLMWYHKEMHSQETK